MLISEILNEDELNERPVGLLTRGIYKLGSKLGSSRAMAGHEVSKEANLLKREFLSKLEGGAVSPNAVDPKLLQNFLNDKGYGDIGKKIISDTLKSVSTGSSASASAAKVAGLPAPTKKRKTLTNKMVDEILLKVVQAAYLQVGGSKRKGRFATGTTPAKSRKKTSASAPQLDPQAAIQALQQMGYTVTPPGGTT